MEFLIVNSSSIWFCAVCQNQGTHFTGGDALFSLFIILCLYYIHQREAPKAAH